MKLGIAFAGGGVRGAAHLGILQALEEAGITADFYAGTSAGSIVATMKALGYSNATCLEMMEAANNDLIDIAYWDIIKSMPHKFKELEGVLKGEKLKSFLLEHIGEKFLMNVKHGLSIISTDVNTGAQVVFTSETISNKDLRGIDDMVNCYGRYTPLSLPHIVYGSCSLPGVFQPITFNKMKLIDGSMTNNLPANVLEKMGADKIIAIDLTRRNPNKKNVSGIFDILSQSADILIKQNTYLSLHHTKNVIRLSPDLSSISLLDFSKAGICYETGYLYGQSIASTVKKALQ